MGIESFESRSRVGNLSTYFVLAIFSYWSSSSMYEPGKRALGCLGHPSQTCFGPSSSTKLLPLLKNVGKLFTTAMLSPSVFLFLLIFLLVVPLNVVLVAFVVPHRRHTEPPLIYWGTRSRSFHPRISQQDLRRLLMTSLLSRLEWRHAVLILSLRFGTSLDQLENNLRVTVSRGSAQDRMKVDIIRAQRCAVLEQEDGDFIISVTLCAV
ncbi:hypothetical protein BDR22DRAFT_553635 [Usnea florida]